MVPFATDFVVGFVYIFLTPYIDVGFMAQATHFDVWPHGLDGNRSNCIEQSVVRLVALPFFHRRLVRLPSAF
jgi:hypothetical protein